MAREAVAQPGGRRESYPARDCRQLQLDSRAGLSEPLGHGAASLKSSASGEKLRRTGGRIANLRSTFERTNRDARTLSPGTFAHGLSAGKSSEQKMSKLKKKLPAEMDRLRAEHQAELSRLQDRLKEESELRSGLEIQCQSLEQEVEQIRDQIAEREEGRRAEYQQRTAALSQAKEQAQTQLCTVQLQLSELKRGMSFAIHIEKQVSDSTLVQALQNLYHEIQNWVANHYRRVKIDKTAEAMVARLESIAEPKQLEYLTPLYQKFDPSTKILAFQATAMCYLMQIWEEPLLFGLPNQEDWARSLNEAALALPSVISSAMFSQWRSVTLVALQQSDSIKQSVDMAEAKLAEIICIILGMLTDVETSETQVKSLTAIINRAVALAHLFRMQRARYEFHLPAIGDQFTSQTMEDMMLDVESARDQTIRYATFPVVIKFGDEDGDNPDMTNVIFKARVMCND